MSTTVMRRRRPRINQVSIAQLNSFQATSQVPGGDEKPRLFASTSALPGLSTKSASGFLNPRPVSTTS